MTCRAVHPFGSGPSGPTWRSCNRLCKQRFRLRAIDKARMSKQANNNGTNLEFEDRLRLGGKMEQFDYKHVALEVILLNCIFEAFEDKRAALLSENLADANDTEECLVQRVIWNLQKSRWSQLRVRDRRPAIRKYTASAMLTIETRGISRNCLLPQKPFSFPTLAQNSRPTWVRAHFWDSLHNVPPLHAGQCVPPSAPQEIHGMQDED